MFMARMDITTDGAVMSGESGVRRAAKSRIPVVYKNINKINNL